MSSGAIAPLLFTVFGVFYGVMKIYAVLAQSGAHSGLCVLGYGLSRKEAIEDAYGPDGRLSRGAWVATYTSLAEMCAEFPEFESDLRSRFG